MAHGHPEIAAHELGFEAHGVRVAVSASDAELLERIVTLLPPEAKPCAPRSTELHFALTSEEGIGYRIVGPHKVEQTSPDRDLAVAALEVHLGWHFAFHSEERIFVRAGVVAHRNRAIVIPGPSFSGKTTLVAALVRAGALYYSDEFALLDERGLVHPYARPLSLLSVDGTKGDRSFETPSEPKEIGVIAVTTYRPGAEWSPQRRSAGHGALALLSHTVPARKRPEQALAVTGRAAAGALVLEGERGEAPAAAAALLEAADEFASGALVGES
jgi:hypothetical protein